MLRTRHAIIHEGAGHELTILIIDGHFRHSLANALRNTAIDLTMNDERIEHFAAIIDGDVIHHVDFAEIRINFDFDHMRAIGIVKLFRIALEEIAFI